MDRDSSQGAIFVELALSIFVLMLLLAGATDIARQQNENLILNQAAYYGAYTTAQLAQFQDLNNDLIDNGINSARDFIGNMGLNPDVFQYELWVTNPLGAANQGTQDLTNDASLNMKIRAHPDVTRFVLLPKWQMQVCGTSHVPLANFSPFNGFGGSITEVGGQQVGISNTPNRSLDCEADIAQGFSFGGDSKFKLGGGK